MEAGAVSEATTRLFDILLQEEAPERILDSLARIMGETLGVDRSLIYDISFARGDAECLTEWLDPSRPEIGATKATYPLALFQRAAALVFESHDRLESHARAPHPVMVADGSSSILHGAMNIASLLWYPFAFRADGFYLLAFNHVTAHHDWDTTELEFVRSATRHVNMALQKIALIDERARAEAVLFAAQRLESLGLLAGGVAHDFNNLMVGVVINAELLARRLPADSPLRELVAQLQHAGQRASALAGQLLAFAGKGQPGVTTVDLAQVVRGTLHLVRSSMGSVEVELRVTTSSPVDCNVSQLEQVVMNLLVNAGEAMRARPGRILVALDLVDLDETAARAYPLATNLRPGTYARLQVSDDGIGMDEATAKRIFDPFFSTKREGRGLGLSAVLGIVKLHHGALRISSTPGVGTTFEVLWPISDRAVAVATPTPAVRAVSTERSRTILCIDDEEEVLRAVEGVLTSDGFEVLPATGGAVGLSMFHERLDRIDGVVLDLTMPAPGGREVLRTLRAERPDLPVVLMSGFTADQTIREALDPRTRFVAKPFVAESLLGALSEVLRPAGG